MVLMVGSPADGFELVGPFDSSEDAIGYAIKELDNVHWWVMEVHKPDEDNHE